MLVEKRPTYRTMRKRKAVFPRALVHMYDEAYPRRAVPYREYIDANNNR